MNERTSADIERICEALKGISKEAYETLRIIHDEMTEAMQPAWWQVAEILSIFHGVMRDAYEREGMCYGPSDEGMWRWAREVAEAERLRIEAEEILQGHRQLADFRRTVKEKRDEP